jgi:hypothetical protein
MLLLLLLFSLPLFLSVCVWCNKAQISLFLCKILLAKLLCLLADFITKRICNVTRPTSLNLFIKKLNQSIRKISIGRLINPSNPLSSRIIHYHYNYNSFKVHVFFLLLLLLLSTTTFYYCLLLDLFIVPRSAHTKQTTHPPLMLSPAFG